jgi:hypothetical protein
MVGAKLSIHMVWRRNMKNSKYKRVKIPQIEKNRMQRLYCRKLADKELVHPANWVSNFEISRQRWGHSVPSKVANVGAPSHPCERGLLIAKYSLFIWYLELFICHIKSPLLYMHGPNAATFHKFAFKSTIHTCN